MKNKIYLCIALLGTISIICFYLPEQKYKPTKNIKREKEERSVALDALQFMTASAAFPNKDIPATAYSKAMLWYQKNAPNTHKVESGTSWQSMGPVNMGGRTIAIALDPVDTSIIWLGSAGGGLWKSTTGGIGTYAWTYVPLGFPVLGVSSIAINPTNNKEMYVGTGEVYSDSSYSQGIEAIRPTRGSYGMGLFKSSDGGITWTQSINWTYQQNRGIWDIVINPLNPKVIYAGTTEGVYKSNDAGAHWTKVLNEAMCMTLQMHKVDTNILLCGVGNYGSTVHGVYRTTNSGATWAAVTSGLPAPTYQGRITFATCNNNNDTMYAHICDVYNSMGIFRSIDKGQTWAIQYSSDIASYQGWYAKGMVVQPHSNPDNILAAGVDIFQSLDGGLSFNQVSNMTSAPNNYMHSDVHNIIMNPKDSNMIYIITDGGLFRSNDFGNTYYECTGGYNTTQSYIGSISSTDTTILLSGLQDNYVIKYNYTGPQTWFPVIGGDGCYNAIDHINDATQYGAYQYLNVLISNNQGNSFNNTQILTNTGSATAPNYAAFLAPYILCYSNTQYIYAGGQALQLSTDGGTTWNYMGNNPVNNGTYIMTIAASYTNTDSIYFATAPNSTNNLGVFSSTNQGTTVTNISSGLPNRYPRRIAVKHHDSRELYIVFSGFGTGHVFKSSNAGASWTDISTSLPDMPFECITVDPIDPNFIYAGCDYGVFVSSNKGATWNTYDVGFPDATMVFDLIVSPSDHFLYAFTHGRGVFKRDLSDLAVGVNNIAKADMDIKVYPNPASDKVCVVVNNLSNKGYEADIYNVEGEKVKTIKLNNIQNSIYVGDLSAGTYFLKINSEKSPQVIKFVKQ